MCDMCMYMFVCECKCEYMSVTVCIWMSDDDKGVAACHPSCLRQGLFFTGAYARLHGLGATGNCLHPSSLALPVCAPHQALHGSKDGTLCYV